MSLFYKIKIKKIEKSICLTNNAIANLLNISEAESIT